MMRCKKRLAVCLGSSEIKCLQGVKTPRVRRRFDQRQMQGGVVPLGITVDSISGLALTIDALPAEAIKARKRVD